MGRFRQTFLDEELLNFLKRHGTMTAKQLCERFDVSRQGMHKRLNSLERRGFIKMTRGNRRNPSLYSVKTTAPWRPLVKDK